MVSSSMVIKVDFDLTMSILTHNIFRLFAQDLERYSHVSDQTLFDKFISNTADVEIDEEKIKVFLKKKKNLPLILEVMQKQFNAVRKEHLIHLCKYTIVEQVHTDKFCKIIKGLLQRITNFQPMVGA